MITERTAATAAQISPVRTVLHHFLHLLYATVAEDLPHRCLERVLMLVWRGPEVRGIDHKETH